MSEERKAQRWIVLIAGILLQTAIGGIYAWSTFGQSLVENYGFTSAQTGLLFGVQVIIFTLVTLPAGKLLQKRGPKFTASIGAILFGLGYILASMTGGSFPLMLVALGGVTGAGLGLVYVCPLTTGMQWFPRNRGMVTGAAVAGFGAGAVVLSNVAEFLMRNDGLTVYEVFRVTGFAFGGIALLSSLFLSFPKESNAKNNSKEEKKVLPLLLSKPYIILAFSMFTGTFAGLLLSAHLKPIMLSQGLVESQALLAISLFAIGNTVGRLTWGVVHDKLEARLTVLLSLGTLLLAVLGIIVASMNNVTALLLPLVTFTGFGFGACFVVYAAAITSTFGVDLLPRLYPVSFIGYGIAALIGPSVGGTIVDSTGSYQAAFVISAVLILISLLGVFFQFRNNNPLSQGGAS